MPFKAFYNCNSTEERVDSANAYDIELDWAANIVPDILRGEGDFFGLTDGAGNTLQFMRESGSVWMEIPSPADRGSYGAHIDIADVRPTIIALTDPLDAKQMANLEFQAW